MTNTADAILNWQNKHKKMLPVAAILSFVFILALNFWQNSAHTVKQSPLLLLVVFFCLMHVPQNIFKPNFLPFALLGATVAFFMVADPLVYSADGISKQWTLLAVPFFGMFFLCTSLIFCGLSGFLNGLGLSASALGQITKKAWIKYFLALVAFWLPVFLSFGPLRISADSYNIIQQALGNYQLTDSHPILYTLVLRQFLAVGQFFGSLTLGAYFFAAAQLCFFAWVLSYCLYIMQKDGAPGMYIFLGLLYFGLCPMFAINAITLWKDIPFNALLLLLTMFLFRIASTSANAINTKAGMAKFLLLCFAICFMRGNGFYLVMLCMLAIGIIYRRNLRKWLLHFLPFLLFVWLVLNPLYSALGIPRLGGVERAAMPLQQVARAVKNGAPLNQSQIQLLETIIPIEDIKSAYVSASPDPIKTHPNFNSSAFDENFADFMRLWRQLFKTNKQVYMDAWLLQTLGYWKVDFHGWTSLTSEYEEGTGIVQHDVWQEAFGINSRRYFESRTGFLTLSSMAYTVLFCAAHFAVWGRSRQVLGLLPLLLVWLGLMLGAPAYAEFRYMLLFPLSLPLVLFQVLRDKTPSQWQTPAHQ